MGLICIWDIMSCCLLEFLKLGFHSPMLGFIEKSLLFILSHKSFCHFLMKEHDFSQQICIWDLESVRGHFTCWFGSWVSFVTFYSFVARDPAEDDFLSWFSVHYYRKSSTMHLHIKSYRKSKGPHCVMVIVIENGHGDTSSNPGQGWLHSI